MAHVALILYIGNVDQKSIFLFFCIYKIFVSRYTHVILSESLNGADPKVSKETVKTNFDTIGQQKNWWFRVYRGLYYSVIWGS